MKEPNFEPSVREENDYPQGTGDRDNGEISEPVLITPAQVAKLLQISLRTLWRMRSGGQLPLPVRIGSSVRWRYDDLKKWIAAGCPILSECNNKHRRK